MNDRVLLKSMVKVRDESSQDVQTKISLVKSQESTNDVSPGSSVSPDLHGSVFDWREEDEEETEQR